MRMKLLALPMLALLAGGCATKWVPDTESALSPPVAFQQRFMADAIDNCFYTMDFSRLGGKLVEIEVMGVYVDGDVADYARSKLQLELAKAGARTEIQWFAQPPDYKANIVFRYGGVNDVVKDALLYEWRQKEYTYDVQVAVMSLTGKDYFTQSGKGATEITIARRLYLIFFPIPLPSEWSTRKGTTFYTQIKETYDAGKRAQQNPNLMRDVNQVPTTIGP